MGGEALTPRPAGTRRHAGEQRGAAGGQLDAGPFEPGRSDGGSALVAAARDEAFDRYVVPELATLYGSALAVTRNHAEAEDLVQDTLVRAFHGVDRFDGRHPRAWLLTILRNTHINRHRRRRPGLLTDPEQLEGYADPASPEVGPEGAAMAGVFDSVVEAAFVVLPEDQQIVICLVDVDGFSYQEAADLLGVPVGTVMSRLHRGRKRIKRKLVSAGLASNRIL